MIRTARPWKGAGTLALAGLLLGGTWASAAESPSLSEQLSGLGRQALAQRQKAHAESFFRKALELDPKNDSARKGLADAAVLRVAMQDPAALPTPPVDPSDPAQARNLEEASRVEEIQTQPMGMTPVLAPNAVMMPASTRSLSCQSRLVTWKGMRESRPNAVRPENST